MVAQDDVVTASEPLRAALPVDHESRVADHMVRRALLVSPAVLVVAGLLAGTAGVVGAALGVAVVCANFLLSSRLIAWSARISPEAITVAAIGGYVLRLGLITLAAIALRGVPGVDLAAFVLTVAGLHLGLLFWEMPAVTLTLGAPGLRPTPPGPVSRQTRKEEG